MLRRLHHTHTNCEHDNSAPLLNGQSLVEHEGEEDGGGDDLALIQDHEQRSCLDHVLEVILNCIENSW